jgi:hypothetical protein
MPAPRPRDRQRILARLTELSTADLAALWTQLDLGNPKGLAAPLSELLMALVSEYGSASAVLAADWFDEAREDARAPGRFVATPAPLPEPERVDALARWGVGPLFGAAPDGDAALGLLTGGLVREVLGMARSTTEGAVTLDPAGPTFARHASANACVFCRMVATRGAVYTSEVAAVRVGGRGTDLATNIGRTRGRRAQGVRARGTQALGEKYHDHCRCTAIEVWPGQTYEEAPYVSQWREEYAEAQATSGPYGAIDLKKTMANWRQIPT